MAVLLGCIADDFTGATDLCNTLVRNGMRAVQLIGVPRRGLELPEAEAVIVALKSRTIPAADAVRQSLEALDWLQAAGARQILFKYCSTFDSTDAGNIGPVGDALLERLPCVALACPAFPETGRTIYRGHLFVGDALLSDTHMRTHPLTPMTDSNLVRVLGRQSRQKVGLVPWSVVHRGPEAIREALTALAKTGHGYAVTDTIEDSDLVALGHAVADFPLLTGGSGIAMGLPDNFRAAGLLPAKLDAESLPAVRGHSAVLAGSCSAATLGQVETMAKVHPALRLEPESLLDPDAVEQALAWAAPKLPAGPVLIYASAPPDQVSAVQAKLGRERAGELVESAMAGIATGLVEAGVRRLVVAGGETSGAVVNALGVEGLRIGAQIDPGVPCTVSLGEPALALALKSGNFGAADFFTKALERMP